MHISNEVLFILRFFDTRVEADGPEDDGSLVQREDAAIHIPPLHCPLVCFVRRGLSHVLRSGGTCDNLDQLASDDSLASPVEKNLILGDHLAGVLSSVLQRISRLVSF